MGYFLTSFEIKLKSNMKLFYVPRKNMDEYKCFEQHSIKIQSAIIEIRGKRRNIC